MEESDKNGSAILKGEDASRNNAPLESNAGSESFYISYVPFCAETRQIPSKGIVEHCADRKQQLVGCC